VTKASDGVLGKRKKHPKTAIELIPEKLIEGGGSSSMDVLIVLVESLT